MTNVPGQQTVTPERQQAAAQIGAVFNSLHEYVRTLEHRDEEGRALLTKQLEFSHQRIDEAAMWAIKHVLTYGAPPNPKAAAPEAPAAEKPTPIDESAANESEGQGQPGNDAVPSATMPETLPTDNASSTESA